jgi:magnesium chelatase family protein
MRHQLLTQEIHEKLPGYCSGEEHAPHRTSPKGFSTARGNCEGNDTVANNADMGVAGVRMYCPLDDTGRSLMKRPMHQMGLTARAYHRVLKHTLE